MTKPAFYITTPIYYPSANLHIGHAYCTTIADTIARYKRANGFDVEFITGSDEHGLKIQRKAAENGLKPIEYVDGIVANFKKLWEMLGVSYTKFVRSSSLEHQHTVQTMLQKVYDKGDIYKKKYVGKYCVPCESFWTDRQIEEAGGVCPDCGRPVETMEEEDYFFKMSKYADRILKHIEDHPDFIQPVSRRNEMIAFLKQGLEDLCISRSSFDWGIPVPFDKKQITYVWFDALLCYFTGIGFGQNPEKFNRFWPVDVHLVGKEIVRFHTIIWPAMLMAMDQPLPKHVYGHGWLVVNGEKMSKSKGNVVDPMAPIQEFGPDAVRYYLLSEIALGSDGNYSREGLIRRWNSDLANDLGNLQYRTVSMIEKYHQGIVHKTVVDNDVDAEFRTLADKTLAEYRKHMDAFELNEAIKTIWTYIGASNKYIDVTTPWILAKDPAQAKRLEAVMYNLADAVRNIAILISSMMPFSAPKIFEQLGLAVPDQFDLNEVTWGKLPDGTKVAKGQPIFPRIEEEKEDKAEAKAAPKKAAGKKAAKNDGVVTLGEITIDDFAKLDLRVATIKAAERVPNTDKLMKITVDIGGEERTIVSGIAKYYTDADLVGKNVIVIANLKPAKLKGIESKGMLLAASDDEGNLVLCEAPGIKSGSKVK
ncbi:MAG: methionine--tRNA ligase [Acidaminococcus sp.]|jgi:methionyl-tRNA synthetase|nr:methionine--tRNA ligase [Acidaminococcus sp.]MCI2099842.1 methionine--tRNA ligase [Acidaminococcus sp.]MCI2114071.1 methionine--tRNA ligase [Acidaminococcus sp.]MCI2115941.1 methionine--tRNA ligase [Acidaminococcus sp.]